MTDTNQTILVVDDSKLSRCMIKTILLENFPQCHVLEATNAEEALAIKEPDIATITLDMNMPGMDGMTLGHELTKRYPDAKVSLITANTFKAIRDQADSAGFNFVAKPITEEKIINAVNTDNPPQK